MEFPIDHIHMVVRTEPKVSPADIVQVIKSISARKFFKLYPEIKNKFFLGRKVMDTKLFCRNDWQRQ